jgi:Aldehyde dehydrogenase family
VWDEAMGDMLKVTELVGFACGIPHLINGPALMNASEFANGSLIYTQSGYYARKFLRRMHGGMVGISVGIPAPLWIFGLTGHKNSFFGDLHAMGADGIRFFTELKSVTAHWFSDKEAREGGASLLGRHDLYARSAVATRIGASARAYRWKHTGIYTTS